MTFHELSWHEKCFQCSICRCSLSGKKFAFRHGQLFCSICLIDQFGQRCERCNRPFQPGRTDTRAEQIDDETLCSSGASLVTYQGRVYHSTCFLCQQCSQPMDFNDVRRRDAELLCSRCAEQLFSIRCVQCREKISSDGVIVDNHPFHRRCLRCEQCRQSFDDEGYVRLERRLYCPRCVSSLLNKGTHVTSPSKS